METNGSLAVSGVTVRQAPQVNPDGTVTQATILSFMVGSHGPFTMTWPRTSPAPADLVAAITAQVEQLRALDTGVQQLNQRG
jgi:hypothetical protein